MHGHSKYETLHRNPEHSSVLFSFGILTKEEELGLPLLYWIPE